VQSVASEAPAPAFKPSLPNPAPVAPSSDRGQPSPFDALLDAGTEAAAQPPQSPPPAAAPTAPSDSTEPPLKKQAQDCDVPKTANIDSTPNVADPGNSDVAATGGKAVSSVKAKTDAKICEQDATVDDTKLTDDKTANDGKPADSLAPAVHTALLANNAAQAVVPAAAALVAVVPQTIAATTLKTTVAATEDSKGEPAIDLNASAAKISAQKSDGKPQPATGDPDKFVAAPSHDETPATGHHAATVEVPPTIADAQAAAPKTFADAVQQAALTAPLQDVTQTAANPAAPAPPATEALAVPLAGVAVEIAGKAFEGKNRFEIRLDPPELGRIEVRLDVDRDGNAVTRLIADRSDTLDLLRRDANNLQQALQDAGLKTSDNGLQFSLRDQSMGRDQSNTPMPAAAQIVIKDDGLPVADISPRNYPRLAGLGGGIDIRV
jgi:chemotaxis protein MotD